VLKDAIRESHHDGDSYRLEDDAIDPALIQEELRRIVSSRYFQTSRRGREFLLYVVNQKINGNGDLLKERLIGIQVFGRKPDYSTGDDPIVRVQAGDVRRRLESYHADAEFQSDVLIHIPLGCYAPVFHRRKAGHSHEASPGGITKPVPAGSDHPLLEEVHESSADHQDRDSGTTASSVTKHLLEVPTALVMSAPENQTGDRAEADTALAPKHRVLGRVIVTRAAVLACLALVGYLVILYFQRRPEPVMKAFWSPVSASSKPVLLWLPKPMVYRPSDKLFDRYEQSHPDALITREARQDQLLPLSPTDTIQWGDMIPSRNAGPGMGGVIAAINMSKLLTQEGIRFELRFGEETTYAEMRDSPVVIVGAINTPWAAQLTSEANFVFDETRGAPNIHETGGAKRVWKMETSGGHITRDYGMITRQLSGKAGQFLVQVAGISHFGTEAASEMLLEQQELAKILHSQGISLEKKNLQIVVQTDVTDQRAGPPHIVAVSSW
jgi:hypothetical protein